MIPLDKIKKIIDTYQLLEKDLASGDISKKDFVKKSKEYSSIGEIINEENRYFVYVPLILSNMGKHKESSDMIKSINEVFK